MNSKGVTMIELMVVVTIMGVTAVLVAPTLGNLVQRNRVSATADALERVLETARSESIKRGAPVEITPIPASPSNSNEFGEGVRVWFDSDGDGAFDTDELLLQFEPQNNVTVNAVTNFTALDYLPSGRVGTAGGQVNYRIDICAEGDTAGQRILVTRQNSRIERTDIATC